MPDTIVEIPGVGNIAFPDTMSPADISAASAKLYKEKQGALSLGVERTSGLDKLSSWLPSVGGAVGGVVGGIGGTVAGMGVGGVPGAVGGAALGGMTGESLRQVLDYLRQAAPHGSELPMIPPPTTAGSAAANVGGQGALQAITELAGAGLGKAASAVGHGLMENAVRPTMGMVREFPNVIDTLMRERLPVGRFLPGMKTGSVMAAEKLGASASSVKALLAKATTDGTTFGNNEVAKPVLDLIDEIGKQPIGNAEEQQLGSMIDEFLQRHPGPLTPLAVKDLKQQAQAIAKPIFKAAEKGFPVAADQALKARFNGAIASGSKTALETIPGVGAGEQHTQELIGATRALKQAQNRRLSLMAEGASAAVGSGAGEAVGALLGPDSQLDGKLKQSVVGWLLVRGLMSPRSMSRGGLVLTHGAAQAALRQFPRLAAAMATQGTTAPAGSTPLGPQ